jgi:hypothetical protein
VRREIRILLVALGASAAVGVVIAGGCVRDTASTVVSPGRATAQEATLDWHETAGEDGQQLAFDVERFAIIDGGWEAEIGFRNDTKVAWEVGDGAGVPRTFGVMLFRTGDMREFEQRNRGGDLPAVRPATRFEPELPRLIGPGETWKGTISAPGSLVSESYVRVVFGMFASQGDPPKGLTSRVVWITDNTFKLER